MIINPFLLAGKDQIIEYQKQRVKDWEESKGESRVDFDSYFDKILDQWGLQEFDENIIDDDMFVSEDIDFDASSLIKEKLTTAGLLNENGFINLNATLTVESISTIIDEIGIFSTEDKQTILSLLESTQSKKSETFETFSKQIFEFFPSNGMGYISSEKSIQIWDSLKRNGIIDEYGLLIVSTESAELNAGVNLIPGLNDEQRDRILGLLNKHPELSYNSYKNNYFDEELPGVGAYIPNKDAASKISGLTKEEYDYIKVMALLEWSIMSITQKNAHKSRKKTIARAKAEKKKIEMEELQHLAKLEANYRDQHNQARKAQKKKG